MDGADEDNDDAEDADDDDDRVGDDDAHGDGDNVDVDDNDDGDGDDEDDDDDADDCGLYVYRHDSVEEAQTGLAQCAARLHNTQAWVQDMSNNTHEK